MLEQELDDVDVNQTCKKALKGAKPVPGPIIIIGTAASEGNLKFDCLTKIGTWLHSWVSSCGDEFCQSIENIVRIKKW